MALDQRISKIARERIGLYLSDIRKHKGLSKYAIAKSTGLHPDQINAIESGSTSYTIDSFLAYIAAIEKYILLNDKF